MQMRSKDAKAFSHKYDHSLAVNHTATILFDGQYHTHDTSNFHCCVHGQ
jgi:hypothetical protein